MTTMIPWLQDELRARGPGGSRPVATLLEAGRKTARGDDVSNIKKDICKWYNFEPELPLKKDMRGFRHDTCGRLLCPTTYDWDKPDIRQALQRKDKKFDIGSRNWPNLLWRDEKPDPDDFHVGFLKHELIVKAALRTFRGPTVANSQDGASRGTRKSIAAKHGMTEMTAGAIAYCVMMVHFVLSSQAIFGAGGERSSGWAYRAFYQEIVHYVERQMPRNDREELFAWWNERIFPEVYTEEYDDDENSSPSANSMAAKMIAQVREREEAAKAGAAEGASASAPLSDSSNTATVA
ncbi:hypothetical protein OE88DRAFT_364145 [Heliocybe sulcata]|uniref:Uncharacterized protein n=1 Tax=Heliocybe sulcata TaxID=5364 RepID=A0A5C3MZL8_9AGAM|nr:hypothetical protein OE88DRAFT_364145 [Heliocybe sulcata]